jgi:hypothetical protein
LPLNVGVPEITPLEAIRLSPAGRLPEVIDHVYGVVPAAAVRAAVYGALTTPCGKVAVEIARGDEVLVVLAAAILTGTACDSCIVCGFRTCN